MIMVMTKNKLKSIQKSLKKGMPNLSRRNETDNQNRIWINPDKVQLEMLQELRYIADTISPKEIEIIQPEVSDLLILKAEDPRPDSQYDSTQLQKGMMIELEHTNNAKIAKKIAKDHLDEFKNYYTALEEMEQKLATEQ